MNDDDHLHGLRYYTMRNDMALDLTAGIAPQDLGGMIEHARQRGGMTRGEATAFVERFAQDLRRHLTWRRPRPS